MDNQTQTLTVQNKLIEVGIAFQNIADAKRSAEGLSVELQELVNQLREELAVYEVELEHLRGVELANHTLELNNHRLQHQVSILKQHNESLESKASTEQTTIAVYKDAFEDERRRADALEKELSAAKVHFNELKELAESQNPELVRQRDILEKQNSLIIKQKGDLDKLLDKHNTEVRKANAAIRNLESLLEQQQVANKALKRKVEKNKLTRGTAVASAPMDTSELWREGKESLSLAGKVTLMSADGPIESDKVMWWEHDCGIKLVCAYSHDTNQVMICDPRDAEGNLILPCDNAVNFIMATFSKQA